MSSCFFFFAERHDATVRVVGVQDEQLLLLRCCREAYHQHGNQQYVLGILYHNIEFYQLSMINYQLIPQGNSIGGGF